ncbi:MAG: hypothetical protein K2X97_05650 [Mycobacteriaceae bacterium]|nr:hypothetical protein [Mycobacteriaceae bacterium]
MTARERDVPVAAVSSDVTVRVHRPAGLPERAPALLWVHGQHLRDALR